MSYNPVIKTESLGVTEEASFLASEHAMFKRAGVTLDNTQVVADGNGDKFIAAGTLLGEVTATGKFGPYDDGAIDGTEVAAGVLLETVNLRDGDVVAGMLIHGSVLTARLTGHDAAAEVDLAGQIIFQ